MTLKDRVLYSKRLPVQDIKRIYGTIGVDIFEGRKPTILSDVSIKKPKTIIERIKEWWNGGNIDYEESDRLSDVLMKYAYIKKSGTVEEIRTMFGEEGVSELKFLKRIGMFE